MSKKNRNKQNQSSVPVQEVQNADVETEIIDETVPTEEQSDVIEVVEASEVEETPVTEQEEELLEEEVPVEETEVEEQEESNEPVIEEKKEQKVVTPIYKQGVINVEQKTASQVAAAKAVVSPAVEKFNELSNKYIEIMSKPIDEDVKRCGIAMLANIARHVIMTTDVAVFEACFKFFVKQRAIMMNSTTVIDGINKYLDKGKIAKVVQFYVTFQTLAESKMLGAKFTLNVTTIRRLFNNDALANWLLAKRNTR